MPSHKKVSGMVLTAAKGTRFKKRASGFNKCMGKELKGQSHPAAPAGMGGRRNVGWHNKFIDAIKVCATADKVLGPKDIKTPVGTEAKPAGKPGGSGKYTKK